MIPQQLGIPQRVQNNTTALHSPVGSSRTLPLPKDRKSTGSLPTEKSFVQHLRKSSDGNFVSYNFIKFMGK